MSFDTAYFMTYTLSLHDALPICPANVSGSYVTAGVRSGPPTFGHPPPHFQPPSTFNSGTWPQICAWARGQRSEERRVGKECSAWWWPAQVQESRICISSKEEVSQ